MSKVPLGRSAVLCVLIVAVIAGCKSSSTNPPNPISGACPGVVKDKNGPVVCVSGGGGTPITVDPPSALVWNMKNDHVTLPDVQWISPSSPGDLKISMKTNDCLETPVCSGGHCSAKVKGGIGTGATPGSVVKRCNYGITLNGTVLDPEVVVVGCCS